MSEGRIQTCDSLDLILKRRWRYMIQYDTSTLYLTTFHAFIPPIRSVSACKGCCLAPRNNHGSQNPIELKNLKTLEGVTKNRAWITDDTCKLCKDCIPWNQVSKECIHWLDLDLRRNLTLESLLRPIKESIRRCLKNAAVREFFAGPYIWAYQNWGRWSTSKNLVAKRPGARETGTWMLTITNHEFNPAGYLNNS